MAMCEVKLCTKLAMYMQLLLLNSSCQCGIKHHESIEVSRQKMFHYLTDSSRYDSVISPKINGGKATKVEINIIIHGLHTISATTMDASVDMFLYQIWRDYRLDYSKNNTAFTQLEVDPKSIELVWHPDVFILNEKHASLHSVTTKNELMHIYKNGTVMFCMRLSMTLNCPMKLDHYPFDSQTCPIYVQSFGYTADFIDLQWRGNNSVDIRKTELPQFVVQDEVTYKRTNVTYETGVYTCLQANFHLQRKVQFFFIYVFTPSFLLVILSWLSFFVDPRAVPARITIGVTCILTMVTQSSSLLHVLPPVSYVKSIDLWIFTCLIFVFAPLFEYAYVNSLLQRHEDHQRQGNDGQEDAGGNGDNVPLANGVDVRIIACYKRAKRLDYKCRVVYPFMMLLALGMFALYNLYPFIK